MLERLSMPIQTIYIAYSILLKFGGGGGYLPVDEEYFLLLPYILFLAVCANMDGGLYMPNINEQDSLNNRVGIILKFTKIMQTKNKRVRDVKEATIMVANMNRICIFCGSNKELTREHVFPDWLSSLFNKKIKGVNEVRGDNLYRKWQSSLFQDKIKTICKACNNGWMSDVESDAKSILTKLAFTYDVHSLTYEDQRKLALWAQKTTLVISKATGGKFNIPHSFYEQLYEQKQPLANILVTMGWRLSLTNLKTQPLASFEIKQVVNAIVDKDSVAITKKQVEDGGLIWASSLVLGNIVFQVIGTNFAGGQLTVGVVDPRIFPQVNPYEQDVLWPTEWPIEAVGGLDAMRRGMYGDTKSEEV